MLFLIYTTLDLIFAFVVGVNNAFMTLDNVSVKEVEILPFSAEIKTYNQSNTLINTFVLKNDYSYMGGLSNAITFYFNYDFILDQRGFQINCEIKIFFFARAHIYYTISDTDNSINFYYSFL